MADVQKMLEALECRFKPLGEENCSECRYECRGATFTKVQYRLCMDLVEFLETHEPKVMTLEDLCSLKRGDVVWLQDKDKPEVIAGIVRERDFNLYNGLSFTVFATAYDIIIQAMDSDYLIRWCCWTSRPTNKQREEVKWNG